MKGIAFDIVFQNADTERVQGGTTTEEEEFAKTLIKYPNIVISTTESGDKKCFQDNTGAYETCDGIPRSVYKDAKL